MSSTRFRAFAIIFPRVNSAFSRAGALVDLRKFQGELNKIKSIKYVQKEAIYGPKMS